MNQFFEKYPWLKSVGCGILVLALVLSICLPLMGMRSAEPDNPILQAEPQEITVLQAGKAPGGAGSGDGAETSGSGANGDTDSDLQGDVEQPDPEETDAEAGQDTTHETIPQEQPTQPDYSEADIGTNTDSNQGNDGEDAGASGEMDEDLPLAPLDLGAALTWYKYGSEPTSIVCAPGQSIGKRVLLAQLDNGYLPYSLDLTGLDAQDAVVTGAFFTRGNETPSQIDTRGAVPMSLPDGAEYQNYVFIVQAHATQKNQKGETVETDVQFTFILRLESGIDLDLQMSWQALTASAQATCSANGSISRTIKGDTIQDGLFQYDFSFLGESAREAEFVSADYRATDGETGVLTQSGTLQMAPADGQDSETYFITVTARVSGQTIRYNFVLTYEDGLDLQLQFTWYEKSATRRENLCDANKRINLTLKHNQLNSGLLDYRFDLKGKSAADAQILSATIDGTALNPEKGSYQLTASEGGATYTILVTAKVDDKTVTFTVTLRYQSDVSLQMTYTLTDPDTHASIPNSLTCENGKTTTAEPIYDDQLTDDLLSYQFTISGEEASDVTITSVSCYQSGNFSTKTLTAPSGSVALLLAEDGTAGENTFTVKASGAGAEYTFTFSLSYKHRGDQEVQIECDLAEGGQVTNGQELDFRVRAWSEDAQHRKTYISYSGLGTILSVKLDGVECRFTGVTSDNWQQFKVTPSHPAKGDTNEHTLVIVAEDAHGNKGERTIRLIGKSAGDGEYLGDATIVIDLGVLGLSSSTSITCDVLAGEPVSSAVARAVWGYQAEEPFTAKVNKGSLGWSADCDDPFSVGFYLRAMDNGNGLGTQANALSGSSWRDYGDPDQETVFAAIDARFTKGTNLDILWRCIYKNGIKLNNHSSDLGEFDFTQGSGWEYAINGSYPSVGMGEVSLKPGDTLTLRYTLAYGHDLGNSATGGNNHNEDTGVTNVGFCVIYRGGGSWSESQHELEAVTKDGVTKQICKRCGLEDPCKHPADQQHYVDQEDGTCVKVCKLCGAAMGDPEAHLRVYTDDANSQTHTITCEHQCGFEETGVAHVLEEDPTQNSAQKPTCESGGVLRYVCKYCKATVDEEHPQPLGHDFGQPEMWYSDSTKHYTEHYQICTRCGQEVHRGQHQYVKGEFDWACSICGMMHVSACMGSGFRWDQQDSDADGHTLVCATCGLSVKEGHDTLGANGSCSVCGYTKAPEIPEHDCAANARDFHDNGDGTHTGTCSICGKSVTQAHDTLGLGGGCSVCGYTPQPIDPTVPVDPTEPTEPETPTDQEGEHTDE